MRQHNNDAPADTNPSALEALVDHLSGKVRAYVRNVATEGLAGLFGSGAWQAVFRKRLADLATAVQRPFTPSSFSPESQRPTFPTETPP